VSTSKQGITTRGTTPVRGALEVPSKKNKSNKRGARTWNSHREIASEE